MPSPDTNHKTARPVVKFLGQASGQTWKEVRADVGTEPTSADMLLKSDVFAAELREFLATPNLLVLAGSGTSLGEKVSGPSMEKLWKGVRKLKGFAEASKVVRHPETDENVESLLSRCKSALQFLQGAVKTIVEEFVRGAEQEIFEQCSSFLGAADLGAHKEFLRRLASRSATQPRLRLFTTNYDRCFEQAAGELSYPMIDGFSYSLPRRYAAKFFHYDFIRREARAPETGDYVENVFQLVKLHGSVDWDVRAGAIVMDSQPARPCLIYPVNATLEPACTQPYLEMMGQFLTALRQPNTALLTLGYGFADESLLQPIRTAMESNPSLKLWVVDRACEGKTFTPGSFQEQLKKRVALRDDRIALINADFDQFVELIPSPTQITPEEKLVNLLAELRAKS